MGNKPATTTTTQSQTRNPWAPAVKPLTNVAGRAETIGSNVDNFKPLYSDTTNTGIQGLENAAYLGSDAQRSLGQVVPGSTAGFNTGLGQLASVAGGDYVNANPFANPVLSQILSDTASGVNSQFTAAGRYGSGAHTQALTRNLGNVATKYLDDNYRTERAAQDNAARTLYGGGFTGATMGSQLDQSKLWAPTTLLNAGQLRDQQLNAARTAPMNAVQWEAGILDPIAKQGGTSNGTSTSQTVQPVNGLTTALGVGQMGLGLLTGNPMMIAGGASSTMGSLMPTPGRVIGQGAPGPWQNPDLVYGPYA